MSLLANWRYRQKLIVQAVSVEESVTGFSAVITRAHLDDSVVDPANSAAARVDGGDIRFSSDIDGLFPLACDVVNFSHDSATAASDAVVKIVVLFDVSSAVDTDLWMWFGNSAATQPVPSSSIGSQNAYDGGHAAMYPGVFGSQPSATSLWMVDPKAVTYNGATYYTWLDSLSTRIKAAKYTHATGQWSQEQEVATPSGVDAHQAPSILVDNAGFIWIFWGDYTNAPSSVWTCKSTTAESVTTWDAASTVVTGTRCTYPSAVQLSTGEIVLFYRDGTTATDVRRIVFNGVSWVNDQQILLSAGADRPYYLVALGQGDRVHIAYHWYANGHRDLYYTYTDNAAAVTSSWSSADGTALSVPMAQNATQLVFNSDVLWDTGYLGGLSIGALNQPHIAFSVTDAISTNTVFHYTYVGAVWESNTIVAANGVEVTGYAAGVVDCDINADDNSNIQCAICVDISGTYEIQEYSTTDGATWGAANAITVNSSRNNRLVCYAVPVVSQCRLIWQNTDALHYNTGRADHHFLSSNNDGRASWVDFLTKTTTVARDRTRNHVDVAATGTPTEITGSIGSAFNFNGVNEYFSAATNTPTTEGITLSCLLNTDNAAVNQNPIGLGNNGSSGHFRQMVVSNGTLRSQKQADSGTVANANTSNTVTAATWQHAVSTFTGVTQRATYLNMDVPNRGINTNFVASPSVDFVAFGALRRASIAQYFDGSLEHVRIASVVYTEGRLITEFNNLNAPSAFILYETPIDLGGGDTLISATVSTRVLAAFDASVSQALDTNILALLNSRTTERLDASIFAGQDTVIDATHLDRAVTELPAIVQIGNDVNIVADANIRTLVNSLSSIFAGVDTAIQATVAARSVSPQDATVVQNVDTIIAAQLHIRTVAALDAEVFAGQASNILATVSARTLEASNAQVQIGLDINIAADAAERVKTSLSAVVSAIVDTEITALVDERQNLTEDAIILSAIQLQGSVSTRVSYTEDAEVFQNIVLAIEASTATRAVSSFAAIISSDLETHIQASVVNLVTEAFNASVSQQHDTFITADTDFRIIDDTDAQIFAGNDTNIDASVLTRIGAGNAANVAGIGGLALSATVSIRNLEAFDALIFPGLVIKASTAERVLSVFDANIFDGHLVALVSTRNVVDYLSTVSVEVDPPATFVTKGVEGLLASITLQAASSATVSVRNVESLNALVAFGAPLNITASTAKRGIETFKALVSGSQVIECNIENLNLTIPHAILDPQEQQRVLIENFMLLQECFRQLQAFMFKCCAAKGTRIFAQVDDRSLSTRNAFIEQASTPACIYEDFIYTRGYFGVGPETWWKMNDTGTPVELLSSYPFWNPELTINYVDPSFGSPTNNVLLEQPSVITQAGTTSVSFNTTALESSPVLHGYAGFSPDDDFFAFQFDFWVRLSSSSFLFQFTDTLSLEWNAALSKKILIEMESEYTNGSIESTSIHEIGDIVHIGASFNTTAGGGVFENGTLELYVNGISQGSVYLDGAILINNVYGNTSAVWGVEILIQGSGGIAGIPVYIDQLAMSTQHFNNYISDTSMLETYNCGIGA